MSDPYIFGNQEYPTFAVIDPATGKAISPAGGGGGPVTIADGADVAQGTTTDPAYTGSTTGRTIVGVLKGIYNACTAATPAGSAIIGSVLGRTSSVAVAPAVTSGSAYAAGNVVGGLITFANALDAAQSGIVQAASLRSKSAQTAGFKLYVFRDNPTASTFTDKAAPAIAAADFDKLVDVITLSTADSGLGTHTLYSADSVGRSIVSTATSLWGVLVTTGTPTFASTSDLSVLVSVLKD